ncbi:2-oxoglutarate and iron-dependent oxygenase domain-containing protein 2 isoform X1 [Astyanax mexicanus]|uniref:2-oxoglutarate and iron-dependent oxygenase domain-containing protein 2 isoform X1 n=1 Tax=Astyanax mexicanus TaxID=7994 RepID=A0A8T2KUB0_ASTMX|nr:2-oxoglutarate and iron-dependent oxygenase domain-containing protein 2 isoform X1 [Astyanax mexicanus]
MQQQQFYSCSCYCTDNLFLQDYKLHVRFGSEEQFRTDYHSILRSLGCSTELQFSNVLQTIHAEIERRRNLEADSAERKAAIKEKYRPLHQHVYCLQESYLIPEFLQIVKYCQSDGATQEGLMKLIDSEAAPRVYRFPIFTKNFCRDLIEELEHFEESDAPKGRPNTMNNYGILLNELGFDEGLITPLRERYLRPLSALLYPDCGGQWLDSHKAFVVKYAMNEDLDLSYHYDNAEVTLNVSLGKDFTEGNLYFGDMKEVPLSETECAEVEHRVTEAVLHRGQQMHGALPISSGLRWNLIIWMRASRHRNRLCPMCGRTPRLQPSRGHGDGFTAGAGGADGWSCALT